MKIVRKFLSLLLSSTLLMSSCGIIQARKIIREDAVPTQTTSQSGESSETKAYKKKNMTESPDKAEYPYTKIIRKSKLFRKLQLCKSICMTSALLPLIIGAIIDSNVLMLSSIFPAVLWAISDTVAGFVVS